MATVPVLIEVSDLKGSNLPPSGFSVSPSGFLSDGFGTPGMAAQDRDAAIDRIAAVPARKLNRLMIVLPRNIAFAID
jgi:hypothetical protein